MISRIFFYYSAETYDTQDYLYYPRYVLRSSMCLKIISWWCEIIKSIYMYMERSKLLRINMIYLFSTQNYYSTL